MTKSLQINQSAKIFRKINADARHKANQRGKKEQEEMNRTFVQMRL